MKIKITRQETTHKSISKYFMLNINNTELEISKTWFLDSNSCSNEENWNCIENEGQKFYDNLSNKLKDELDDFISELE